MVSVVCGVSAPGRGPGEEPLKSDPRALTPLATAREKSLCLAGRMDSESGAYGRRGLVLVDLIPILVLVLVLVVTLVVVVIFFAGIDL